jgi:hypothetical protein
MEDKYIMKNVKLFEEFVNEAIFNFKRIAKELNKVGYDAKVDGDSVTLEDGPNPWADQHTYTWHWDGESVWAEAEHSTQEWSEAIEDMDDFMELMDTGELDDGGHWG